MIVDIQQYFRKHPAYNKLVGDDYLFVEYKCPIDVENFKLYTDSHVINYVISGKKDWFSPNQTFEIEGGDALFVRKGVYTTKQHFEVDYCVILFFISDDFVTQFFREHPNLQFPSSDQDHDQIFEIHVDDSFKSLIFSIFNYFKQSGEIPKGLVEIKFRELLFNILLNPKNRVLAKYLYSLMNTQKADMEYTMLKNFQYDLGMEEFARLCGRSLSTFKRDFKSLFHQTPGNWIKNKRLEYAKTLLDQSNLTVNEICYESGFKNPSHFNKSFKEKYGLPPLQFRTGPKV
ncbi:helix-turn-helix domain-containing protein [Flagellimonas myxillae]|uniref:helix-turn-helix domain-containing protein n=1 Tax=Flagellimonas myxillae TaxID=2942214 RepID=UPI00201EE82E|nr:helix-turn-helix domain-containing protein [Muricauda myxillae]MCL6266754.1 AraC family transcriptional regulator [Muricauda myxillae]